MRIAIFFSFIVVFSALSNAITCEGHSAAPSFEDNSSRVGIFFNFVYDSCVSTPPPPKFPHYSADLAELYKKTYNPSDLAAVHLTESAQQNIISSVHEVIDTVGQLMQEHSLLKKGKSSDRLYQNGIRFIGEKALRISAEKGHVEIAEILLDNSVSMDIETKNKETLLHLASKNGHLKVVQLLLSRGVSASKQDKLGNTALHLLHMSGSLNTEIKEEIERELCEFSFGIEYIKNNQGQTPLDLKKQN